MLYTFWKGTLLSKFKVITEEECLKKGKDLIEHSIRQNIPVKTQIKTYIHFLNGLKKRKDNNLPIYRSDHQLGFHSLMALCYFKIVNLDDDDTGIFISPVRIGKTKSYTNQKKRKTYPSNKSIPVV